MVSRSLGREQIALAGPLSLTLSPQQPAGVVEAGLVCGTEAGGDGEAGDLVVEVRGLGVAGVGGEADETPGSR